MHYINMRIAGKKLDFDGINKTLKMKNVVCHKSGDMYECENEKNVFEEDIWQARLEVENDRCLEKEIESFIVRIYECSSYINQLSLDNDISLWLTVYPENVQLNLHLSNSIIKKIYEMGISFDLSIMNLNELYNL